MEQHSKGAQGDQVLPQAAANANVLLEQNEYYQMLFNLDQTDLVPNKEPFLCPVCFYPCGIREGVVLHDCLHIFCKPCLIKSVKSNKEADVKCPFRDNNYACDSVLQEREIKALVPQDIYEQYLAKSPPQVEKRIANTFLCTTPDCHGWCVCEDNIKTFQCPECFADVTTTKLGWKCPNCTLVNSCTSLDCTACDSKRPLQFVVPKENSDFGNEMKFTENQGNQCLHLTEAKKRAPQAQEHYQDLVGLGNSCLVPNTEPFVCPICLLVCDLSETVVVHDCLHTFCKPCLVNTVQNNEEAEVKCPFRDNNYTCGSVLQESEIKALVPQRVDEQHLAKSFDQAANKIGNIVQCSPECPGWILDEDNLSDVCPSCCVEGGVMELVCATKRPLENVVHEENGANANETECVINGYQDLHQAQANVIVPQEHNVHYQELLDLGNSYLVPNSYPFVCSVCSNRYDICEGVVLHECLHTFCQQCLVNTVQFNEEAEVKCPFRDDNYVCDSFLLEREIKALVPQDIYEQYLAKSLAHAEERIGNTFLCSTPDCHGWCICEDDVKTFRCPECFADVATTELGWKCTDCTLVNSCTSLDCTACSTKRPLQFVVPKEDSANGKEVEFKENQGHKYLDQVAGNKRAPRKQKEHYQELVDLGNSYLVPNTEPFDCPICFITCDLTEGVVLHECLHTFCKPCLVDTVQYNEEAEVKCPYRDNNYSCESVLQEREIKALVPQHMYEKYLANSITQAESRIDHTFHCKTPDCHGWCIYEDDVNEFPCPVCHVNNCLTCQVIHEGINCKQYQRQVRQKAETNDEARLTQDMLEAMIECGDAMACPACHVVIKKKGGCDWLKCTMCKTEICWVTRGPRWGPRGKGDTTGGCKCGINRAKCHSRCGNCH